MEEFARPDFGDETVDEIVIVSLSKRGFCRLVMLYYFCRTRDTVTEGLKMTIGQIIAFAMICFAFWLGNRSGYANGYVAGRKAVRKHYEKLEQQFKVSR